MLGAAIALICAGLLIAGYAVWRLGAGADLVNGFASAVFFMIGAVLLLVGLVTLGGIGLWALFGS